MRNTILALHLVLLMIGFGCTQNKDKKEIKEVVKNSTTIDSAISYIQWMKLNTEWVPLLTDLDKLLNSGKKSYKNKDFKESKNKIMEAESIINNETKKSNWHKDLLSSSKSLKDLSNKIDGGNTNEEEMDSVIYKVCDAHIKNCWILKDKDTDLWVFDEELPIHLDSAYYYMVKNDTLKSEEELSKANWIINAGSKKYCDAEGEKISDKIRAELNLIKQTLIKGEQATIGKIKIKSSIAKTYFLKAENHYTRATQISFTYDNDRLEGDIELAREIKASVFYLERAFATKGIFLTQKENFYLENALLLGNELLGGYTHPKEDIFESIKDIGRIMLKYRKDFYPEII